MKPFDIAAKLRHIAATIDASVSPDRHLVAADVRRIIIALDINTDFKSGDIMDGIYIVLHGDDPEIGKTPFKIRGTSYKEINGSIGDDGRWFFKIEPDGEEVHINGKVNGIEYTASLTPEVDEDPKKFGSRLIISLLDNSPALQRLFDVEEEETPSHSFDWGDEPLGGQPDPNSTPWK